MPELVYPPVIAACKTMFRVLDLRLAVEGSHHVPRTGGVVLASNHVSYLDFIFCGLGALESRRLVRFMAKDSVFRHRVSGPLMRGMRHIPVDRRAGAESYAAAVRALRAGEAVGVFPEATVSRSLTVKALKSGAARMARDADVPVLPVALWGSQRLWTKDRPRTLTRRHTPITILVGEPMLPGAYPDTAAMTGDLAARLGALVDRAQREYPDRPAGPEDRWWMPAHLGGTAPTPEEADARDAADRAARNSGRS
ncbi:lysophospholipid acyltransferase family protein [Micromonospora craniellae]|uniref:1-acyl-sn-glycerol-3-phosphate acyltransferase n=1 Tax=Micromonospora craniellae TaxID=2294034 RepID=A0A372G4P5_9ACTN|nr:lysophospholipid acyltransferase family protein [Micromonospora craniellae]QOC90650.1 1-acyl-sn-glycerol-3-phosphate acyltransferase [Micromonospora craniellae]RFS47972.1 1-acyl-sn-glycerol-3-phosphate acyltransferase [Micromonospora craniellae]